jgi:uroporphyrinogen decarboxylase
MNRFGFEADFENLKTVLYGGRGKRVPNIELVIDAEIKGSFLKKPVCGVRDEIEFRYQAGYDYAWISVGMVDPAGTVNKEYVERNASRHFSGEDERTWAEEGSGVIRSREDLAGFPWPDPERLDLSPFEEAAACIPPGMKIIAVLGKIFTASWELLGFERFCELLYTEPAFIEELIERVGSLQVAVCERIAPLGVVGAVWTPDDIAFKTGPLLAPSWFRERLFPHYKKMAEICRGLDKPFIYHSDGDLSSMIDTIMDTGFCALHPVEPEAMDIYDLRKRVGKNLCLLGNVRVDTLSTGTRDEIRALVRDRITRLGYEGAYCVGSSNSVPNYVPFENYLAMLEASAEWGRL